MDPNTSLRIATRIHFALLRHYSEDVPVSDLLKGEATAREALWVCAASGIDELVTLGEQLSAAHAVEADAARKRRFTAQQRLAAATMVAATPQDLAWAQNSSGFGYANPTGFPAVEAPASAVPSWLNPSNWLRRGAN